MGPKVQTVQQSNTTTPLTEDIVKILQGEIDQGAFQVGSNGPQQRRAGTALDSFITNLETRLNDPNKISALETQSQRRTDRAVGDQAEVFGAAGGRYSKGLADSSALLRAEAGANLDVEQSKAEQFDMTMLLEGITQLFNHTNRSRELDLGALVSILQTGTVSPETIVSPGIGQQLLSGVTGGAAAYLGNR